MNKSLKKLFDGRIDRKASLYFLKKQKDTGNDISWLGYDGVVEYNGDYYVPLDSEGVTDCMYFVNQLGPEEDECGYYKPIGYVLDSEESCLWVWFRKSKNI